MQAARQDRILQKHGETVKWIGYKSENSLNCQRISIYCLFFSDALVEMDTLRTQRARKLSEFFKKLRHPSENTDNRLDLLNEISEALGEENTSRIIELENLFQRERELLLCKLKDDSLDVLRQRELVVFMDVIKDEDRSKPESENN